MVVAGAAVVEVVDVVVAGAAVVDVVDVVDVVVAGAAVVDMVVAGAAVVEVDAAGELAVVVDVADGSCAVVGVVEDDPEVALSEDGVDDEVDVSPPAVVVPLPDPPAKLPLDEMAVPKSTSRAGSSSSVSSALRSAGSTAI